MDSRIEKLAQNIVNYSISLKPKEKVLIISRDADKNIIIALIKEVYKAGGHPYVSMSSSEIDKELLLSTSEECLQTSADLQMTQMKQMDAYISIRGINNLFELSEVPKNEMKIFNKIMDPIHKQRVQHTKWVLLMCPSSGLAQSAKMSSEKYEDFFYEICNLDYSKMSKAMDSLVTLMEKTDKVRLVAPNTDITFSIKGIPAIKCAGENNIPDGEVFTAPVRESVNGVITYNLDTIYNGTPFSNVSLEVRNGKIVKATSSKNTDILNAILDTDKNARYFGEFAIGVNPYIIEPFNDILFDEKMSGSIHFTPGNCYEDEAPNGNISAVHWDMVLSMQPQHGGGEIYFDDKLIRKDGIFIIPELKKLNPENLL
ncbi:MAG: aminopeptidase [Clostridia bacterium]|nr:aminopeptidase [Clostridia bacterium]